MVKFGERLPHLKHQEWAHHYIDYDSLKQLLEVPSLDTEASQAFFEHLSAEILNMDNFVQLQCERLTRDRADGELHRIREELASVRNFVGTNIIAATKIVKKHDKHVADETLQRASEVAGLICDGAGIQGIIRLHKELKELDGTSYLNIPPMSAAHEIEDKDLKELRSLPQWLLDKGNRPQGQTNDYYNAYLREWHLPSRLTDSMLGHSKNLRSTGWEVDFSLDAKRWSEMTARERCVASICVLFKLSIILLSLYAFICSLSFLASGFRLVAGRQAGQIFRNSEIFNNPIAGVLVGVLVTVLVQSSSTSTSIIITMVGASLLTTKQAIPLIMGANIGTSVTSTIVALAQSGNPDEFRRAFAAATVHDMFNFCSVAILLPVEAAFGYLYRLSNAVWHVTSSGLGAAEKPPDILKVITKPFTKLVMSVDKKVISQIATAKTQADLDALEGKRIFKHLFGWGKDDMLDGTAGVIVLVLALGILCMTLFLIVYTLKSLLKGRIAVWLHRSVNGNVPDLKCGRVTLPLGWVSGYIAMVAGMLITICVQSSSITTSALTPLVGVGVISVDRMYPTVLGANIGTCITGVLAALAADGDKLKDTLRVAYAHLFFNLTGIVLLYVIWPLRRIPVNAAKFLGNTTAKYRWFAILYLFLCFFLIPALFFAISIASSAACIAIALLIVAAVAFVAIVTKMQGSRPAMLPPLLRDWEFLPKWMRSLESLDRCMRLARCCRRKYSPRVLESSTVSRAQEGDLEIAASRLRASSATATATA